MEKEQHILISIQKERRERCQLTTSCCICRQAGTGYASKALINVIHLFDIPSATVEGLDIMKLIARQIKV